jgi:hypothetical protein
VMTAKDRIPVAIPDDAFQSATCPVGRATDHPPPNSHHAKGRPFFDRDIPLLI